MNLFSIDILIKFGLVNSFKMAQSEECDKIELNKKMGKFDGRILRSRQQKRPFQEHRPVKRLFTPEIKRHLKGWLVRRRENPYPNREEKIELAQETGLTYVQICNWFANWRRKLKNSGKNVNELTWSTLIKRYNSRALGNVEHLSISSDDSIWEESNFEHNSLTIHHPLDHCYTSLQDDRDRLPKMSKSALPTPHQSHQPVKSPSENLPQCFQISSTTDFLTEPNEKKIDKKTDFLGKKSHGRTSGGQKIGRKQFRNKLKKSVRDQNWNYRRRRMMEELKSAGGSSHFLCSREFHQVEGDPMLLSKWRTSVALFRPGQTGKTYSNSGFQKKKTSHFQRKCENFHGREELDAAEALTFLSRASRTRL